MSGPAWDRVVLSSNDDPRYSEFAELTPAAWKKFFPESETVIAWVKGIGGSTGNHAKLARYKLAAQYPDDVCLIHDMDSIPLQRKYGLDLLADRVPGMLQAVGAEVYAGTEHAGKFPAGWMCGEGYLFKQLLEGYSAEPMFDHKENPLASPHVFSDESWVRAQLARNPSIRVQHIDRGVDIYRDWIDRSWWAVDVDKLNRGEYVECNFLRPWSQHRAQMQPVVDYICG